MPDSTDYLSQPSQQPELRCLLSVVGVKVKVCGR